MAVWIVRAGYEGDEEPTALDNNLVTIHWNELPDLTGVGSRDDLDELYRETHPDDTNPQVGAGVGQVWAFRSDIKVGDLALIPLKTRPECLAIGEVTGPYTYRTDLGEEVFHTLPLKWFSTDLLRTTLKQDLQGDLGRPKTVYRIKRDNAEERLRDVLGGKADPGESGVKRRLILVTVAELEKTHGKWVKRGDIRETLAARGYDKDVVGRMTYSAYNAKPQLLAWAEHEEDKGGAFTLTPAGQKALFPGDNVGLSAVSPVTIIDVIEEAAFFDWEGLDE